MPTSFALVILRTVCISASPSTIVTVFNADSGSNKEIVSASEMAAKSDLLSQGKSFLTASAMNRGVHGN